jgi:hypothetical protein
MKKIAGVMGTLLGLLSVQAIADEGIVKIDQAAVKAAGGFPYTISKPGSYRLTGNLTVPAAANGINVDTSNVLIDLAGFTITCLGGPNTSGISSDGGTVYYSNVKIHQGTITGCNNAVNFYSLAQDVEVQELTASNYGSYGVIIDSGAVRRSVMTGALVPANNTVSIGLASYGIIEANTLSGDAYGIAAGGVQRLIVSGNLIAASIGAFILEPNSSVLVSNNVIQAKGCGGGFSTGNNICRDQLY